jgi:ankyrin repeat protein
LLDAAKKGNIAVVKSLLEQGVDVNWKNKDEVRIIHIIYTIILFEIR